MVGIRGNFAQKKKKTKKKCSQYFIYVLCPQNEVTRQEIIALAADKNVKELQKRLCSRMEFGTAGKAKLLLWLKVNSIIICRSAFVASNA
jgi:hypothetical protein